MVENLCSFPWDKVLLWAYYPSRDSKFQRFVHDLSSHKGPNFLDQGANVDIVLVAE